MQLQDQEDALYSEQIILDEEIELKKKIALYYHPMVSLITSNFHFHFQAAANLSILNIVPKLLVAMVCAFATRELLEIEQEAIHGVKCANIEKSYS